MRKNAPIAAFEKEKKTRNEEMPARTMVIIRVGEDSFVLPRKPRASA